VSETIQLQAYAANKQLEPTWISRATGTFDNIDISCLFPSEHHPIDVSNTVLSAGLDAAGVMRRQQAYKTLEQPLTGCCEVHVEDSVVHSLRSVCFFHNNIKICLSPNQKATGTIKYFC
jgi:hypothetical protein